MKKNTKPVAAKPAKRSYEQPKLEQREKLATVTEASKITDLPN